MRLVLWPSLWPSMPLLLLCIVVVGAVGIRTTSTQSQNITAISGVIVSVAAVALGVVDAATLSDKGKSRKTTSTETTQGRTKKYKTKTITKTTPKLIGNEQDMGESKASHFKQGLAHFLFFIHSNIAEQESWIDVLGTETITDVNDILQEFFNYSNMDLFGQYMALYARHYVGTEDSGNENLSVQSIENYFSAVKTYYTSSHPTWQNQRTLRPFEPEKWKKL